MKKWSRYWKSSTNRRKQRKYRIHAPNHVRQKMISAHLSKELRTQYKKRSLSLRKGDEIKVMAGTHKGKSGKISKINLKKMTVYVENIKAKKVSGQEINAPIDHSNLMVTKLNLDDSRRMKFVERKK